MAYNREGYAPWSLTREAGVESATVDGTIEVPQYVQPTIDTGFVDEKGNLIDGDKILALFAKYLLNRNLNKSKNIVVSTVMSNLGFENYLKNFLMIIVIPQKSLYQF